MPYGKRRVVAAIVMVAAGGLLAGGCSAHVSIGGTTVPRHSVLVKYLAGDLFGR